MTEVKSEKIGERFLVQLPDDLQAISKLPLAEKITKLSLSKCSSMPKGKVVEKSTLMGAYGIKKRRLIIENPEYFIVPGLYNIENPDVNVLIETYASMKLNPRLSAMQIKDGEHGQIVWRSGAHHLTAIARNGKNLTEKQALSLAKEVGGKVCAADVEHRHVEYDIIRCVKT